MLADLEVRRASPIRASTSRFLPPPQLLSAPIVTGFLAGVAVIIVIHQLPDFFGLPPVGGSNVHRVWHVLTNLGQINNADLTTPIMDALLNVR